MFKVVGQWDEQAVASPLLNAKIFGMFFYQQQLFLLWDKGMDKVISWEGLDLS